MQASLARRIGRPDRGDAGFTSLSAPYVGGGQEGGAFTPGGQSPGSSGMERHGKISAGLLMAMTAGLIAFYVLTRAYQA